MKIIKLPIKFIMEEGVEEMEKLESLSLPYNEEDYTEEGILYVNTDHIVCFNEDSESNVNLTLTNAFNYKIEMSFNDFLELIDYNDK